MSRIESRPSKKSGAYDFFIDFEAKSKPQVDQITEKFKSIVEEVKVVTGYDSQSVEGCMEKSAHESNTQPSEIKTWGAVFNKLVKLYETNACKEHRFVFPNRNSLIQRGLKQLLIENCGFNENNIPQIADVSKFVKECTGWTVRPVAGLLSSRDFFNAFAFRKPLYTPEPDVCHEILGHVALYCDPDFADFAQELGLASLGASDADLGKALSNLLYCIDSQEPKRLPFDPEVCANTPFPCVHTIRITHYQEVYYVVDSFKDMKERVKTYFDSFDRPFQVRYNPYTETIEVLDNKDKILKYAQSIKGDMARLQDALDKLLK
ncbi:aromatic amino acid hydroxylase [Obelidium mucronatum]|nr:aromatic amino acid hydroxylase [Obelidium mucronatum]